MIVLTRGALWPSGTEEEKDIKVGKQWCFPSEIQESK